MAPQERERSSQSFQLHRCQRAHDGQGEFELRGCFVTWLTLLAQDLTLKGVANTTNVSIMDFQIPYVPSLSCSRHSADATSFAAETIQREESRSQFRPS